MDEEARLYHVSSVLNRESIAAFGLDWSRMGAARGIAGSSEPEVAGCFLDEAVDIEFFVRINNTGGPVDMWEIANVSRADLIESPTGFFYLPARIPATDVRLVRRDLPPDAKRRQSS